MGKAELDGALGRKVGVFAVRDWMRLGVRPLRSERICVRSLAGLHETPAGFLQRKCRAACPVGISGS